MSETEIRKLYSRALNFGESLMPRDCAAFIGKSRIKRYGIDECVRVIIDLMERCNFYCDRAEATKAICNFFCGISAAEALK